MVLPYLSREIIIIHLQLNLKLIFTQLEHLLWVLGFALFFFTIMMLRACEDCPGHGYLRWVRLCRHADITPLMRPLHLGLTGEESQVFNLSGGTTYPPTTMFSFHPPSSASLDSIRLSLSWLQWLGDDPTEVKRLSQPELKKPPGWEVKRLQVSTTKSCFPPSNCPWIMMLRLGASHLLSPGAPSADLLTPGVMQFHRLTAGWLLLLTLCFSNVSSVTCAQIYVCVCVCVCACVYLYICVDHFQHRPYRVRTFWPVLTFSMGCVRLKTWF